MGELQKLLTQVRRIAEHREKGSEQEIRRTYRDLLKDLRAFLGERYEKLAEDDKLDYAILQQKGEFARFLEDVERLVVQHTEPAAQSIQKVVEDTYSLCWQGMQDAVKQSVDGQQLHTALQGLHGVTPEVVKQAVNNPISGLTLTTRLQKHRQDVIYGIKQQIGIGLTQGDTYTTMARRVAGEVDGDYQKAVRIVRTETHRVREAGFHDAAEEVHESAQQVGYGMAKTWRTMLDERVRPQHRYRRGKHWVTVIRGPYNHQKMEGVTVPVDQSFDLGGGVTTKAPGQSGVAGQDINCRCFLEYNLKKLDSPENVQKDMVENPIKNDIMKSDKTFQDYSKRFKTPDYSKYKDSGLSKTVDSLSSQIKKHQEKVKKPAAFDPDWDSYTEEHKAGLIKHWKHEIKIFNEQMNAADAELQRRQSLK